MNQRKADQCVNSVKRIAEASEAAVRTTAVLEELLAHYFLICKGVQSFVEWADKQDDLSERVKGEVETLKQTLADVTK